jgi:hypothetical protein
MIAAAESGLHGAVMALLHRLGAPVAVALGAAAFAVATCSSCDDAHEGAGGSDAAEPDAKLEGGGGTGGDAKAEADSPSCIPPKDDGTSLTDPTVWHCIADDRGCGIYVADLSVKTLPAFTWKTCGPGCEEADAVLPIPQPNRTSWPGSSAVEVNGEIVVRLLMEGASTVGYYYQTFRLSDGKTVYAIQFPVKCASAGWTNDGALALPIVDDPFKSVRTVSALSANPGAELAWSNWVNLPGAMPTTFFAWEDGWGLTFMDGSLRVVTSQDATSLTTIDKGAPIYEVASRNHLVVWPGDDGTGQRLVKAWGLQSGLQTLWLTAQALDG